jgi:hypothetical protein
MHCWWEWKLVQPLWKTIWRLLKKLNINRPCDPAIPLLGIYPKDCDSGYSRDTCMFIAVLFTIAKLWKQAICLTTNEWIKKMWYFTQWNFTQSQIRMKFCHLQVHGWNWRTSSYTKLARLRRPKIVWSPSYADYRPKENCMISLICGLST